MHPIDCPDVQMRIAHLKKVWVPVIRDDVVVFDILTVGEPIVVFPRINLKKSRLAGNFRNSKNLRHKQISVTASHLGNASIRVEPYLAKIL